MTGLLNKLQLTDATLAHPSAFLREQIAKAREQLRNCTWPEHFFLEKTNWQLPKSEINPELITKFILPQCPLLVLVNGHFCPTFSQHLEQLHWSLVDPFDDAHYLHESALAALTVAPPTQNAFERLNLAHLTTGIMIQLPAHSLWARPLVLLHLYTHEMHQQHYQPRITITAQEYSQGSVLEIHHYVGRLDPAHFSTNAFTRLELKSSSKLSHLLWQNLHGKAHFQQAIWAQQHSDSELTSLVVSNGAASTKVDLHDQLLATGANATLNGLYHNVEQQKTTFQYRLDHQAPSTTSGQLVKGILHDQAQGTFAGMIQIAPGAQKANAAQLSKALLVSPKAQVVARPHLLVEADDVKCSHGMAVTQLNPDELFYLSTRGISQMAATVLLEEAFAQECLLPFLPAHYRQLIAAEMRNKRGKHV